MLSGCFLWTDSPGVRNWISPRTSLYKQRRFSHHFTSVSSRRTWLTTFWKTPGTVLRLRTCLNIPAKVMLCSPHVQQVSPHCEQMPGCRSIRERQQLGAPAHPVRDMSSHVPQTVRALPVGSVKTVWQPGRSSTLKKTRLALCLNFSSRGRQAKCRTGK